MSKASWFSLQQLAPSANAGAVVEIDIMDEIGAWGVTARDFVSALNTAVRGSGATQIVLNLNCPGGDCNEGFTIFDALQAARSGGVQVTTNITGLAASMASVIMLASDKIRIAENGRVMIHRVTAGGYGNADDLEAVSEVARQFEERIVALYVARSGKDEATIREWMKTPIGTWFFGEEAVEAGFADEVMGGSRARAFLPKWADKFSFLPAALFDISPPPNLPAARGATSTPPPASQLMNLKLVTALARAAGVALPPDADEPAIQAALDAFQPAATPPVAEINLADEPTRNALAGALRPVIDEAVREATAALSGELTAAKAELERLKGLQASGALGASGAGSAIAGGQQQPKPEDKVNELRAQLATCTDAKERGLIAAQIASLRKAA